MLKGIELTFTNGETIFRGSRSHHMKSFSFHESKQLEENLELCGNRMGTRTGFIRFKTKTGREFKAGTNEDRNVYSFHVDGRVLTDLAGNFGGEVNHLCPIVS